MNRFFESIESRTLFSFAGLDASFGVGGVAAVTRSGFSNGTVHPLADGGAIVQVSTTDVRRLDANGKVVKSFGGGDGVLTPDGVAQRMAVDPATGRIALQCVVNGEVILRTYTAKGVLERTIGDAAGHGLADDMVFNVKGHLVIAREAQALIVHFPPGGGTPTFSTIDISNYAYPAGDPIGYDTRQFALTRVLVRPETGTRYAGDIYFVHVYNTEGRDGYAAGTYLDIRRFNASGESPAGGAGEITLIKLGSTRTVEGRVEEDHFQVLGLAAAQDGSITLLGRRAQTKLELATSKATTYGEIQLYRVTDTLGAPRNLDNALQFPGGTNFNPGTVRLALDATGRRAYVIGNSRVAQFDTLTLKPFVGFNGGTGAVQLSARDGVVDADVDAQGRLLLSDGALVRAVKHVVNDFGTPAGVATLLADGTLDVSGTSRTDKVTIAHGPKKRVIVTINGRTQAFARADVDGIVVHTGKGNDTIDLTALPAGSGAYVLPGSGDDSVIGGAGDDTVDGGAGGRDWFDGHFGDDLMFSATGDDAVRGAQRGEGLFATDEIPLFA